MSKVRVVYRPDKTVAIIHPAPKSRRILFEFEYEWLERVFTKTMNLKFPGLPYDDMDFSEIPQSREDRDAWEGEKGKGITINQVKADAAREKITNEIKIQNKIKEQAIDALKAEGKLPEDYEE